MKGKSKEENDSVGVLRKMSEEKESKRKDSKR